MNTKTLLALLFLCGCGGPAGAPDAGPPDAGPCVPSGSVGCGAGQKCSMRPDTGKPYCTGAGSLAAWSPCTADGDCAAGTICSAAPANPGWDNAQQCRPFCDPSTQAHLKCAAGGACEIRDVADPTIGF